MVRKPIPTRGTVVATRWVPKLDLGSQLLTRLGSSCVAESTGDGSLRSSRLQVHDSALYQLGPLANRILPTNRSSSFSDCRAVNSRFKGWRSYGESVPSSKGDLSPSCTEYVSNRIYEGTGGMRIRVSDSQGEPNHSHIWSRTWLHRPSARATLVCICRRPTVLPTTISESVGAASCPSTSALGEEGDPLSKLIVRHLPFGFPGSDFFFFPTNWTYLRRDCQSRQHTFSRSPRGPGWGRRS
jgi:hypothetical protein